MRQIDRIAEQNGYISEKKIDRFKAELRDKIPEIGKMSPEELQEADLDFLIEYKKFVENDLLLYNIWNSAKGDNNSHLGPYNLRLRGGVCCYSHLHTC